MSSILKPVIATTNDADVKSLRRSAKAFLNAARRAGVPIPIMSQIEIIAYRIECNEYLPGHLIPVREYKEA
ncbi:MAG: hypothetical protein WCF85_15870 [Rhodospirillaceae bacterium]